MSETGGSEELIDYRIEQARASLAEARTLLDSGHSTRSVANRAYYAMYYSVLAVLATRGMGTSKHTGNMSFFDREFVKAGVFGKERSKQLHRAYSLRQEVDYRELVVIERSRAEELLEQAESFIEELCSFAGRGEDEG